MREADERGAWNLRVTLSFVVFATILGVASLAVARRAPGPSRRAPLSAAQTAFLDTLEQRTFHYFWDLSAGGKGLTPDRWPTPSFCSVGAVGFALTAYPIGAERGYVTRAAAAQRTLETLRFFWTAKQDTARAGATGYRGFFYHFLDPVTGARFERVELSSMDTALLLGGVLFVQQYFDRPARDERQIRALADSIYRRVDFRWLQVRSPTLALGWTPESGHLPYDWRGYNEAMLLHILALGSPTHPAAGDVWKDAWTSQYQRAYGTFHGQTYLGFAPLFGHQYSHAWIDFHGIADAPMRAWHSDYFENSRRATLAQRQYAIDNPSGFRGYGARLWGLTACDGPHDTTLTLDGRERRFQTYEARGASVERVTDDGTVSPSAAGGSIAFAPEVVVPALMAMRADHGDEVFSRYGFVDALNPTLDVAVHTHHGRVVEGKGWYDTDYLGIDEGPILLMTENYRSGLVWRYMRRSPYVVRGLWRAGFTGGWLSRTGVSP